jgi:YVTN family beta-propeller protein
MGKQSSRPFSLGVAVLACLALTGLLRGWADAPVPARPAFQPLLRRPVALVLGDQGQWLYVANQRSGSLAVIDTAARKVVAEVSAGARLADLAGTPDGRHLLAVDEAAHELVLLRCRGSALDVVDRLQVSPTPVSVHVTPDGSRCFVASLWSRQVMVLDLSPVQDAQAEPGKPRALHTVALPFAPRRLLPVRDGTKLVVADSFGGQLAVVDVRRGAVESVRSLPAHNIRGLATSADGHRLLVTHQMLNRRATTARDDIHWGNLLTNNLRALPLAHVLTPDADLLRGNTVHYLGEATRGGGDPAAVAVRPDGKVLVALAGVGELTLGGERDVDWPRLTVGRRPTAVVASPDGRWAYVANTFADSVSVVDLQANQVQAEIALGPQPALGASDRGELLFYDARLSHDGWLSCHSCHSDGHTPGLLNDNATDGSFGTPKRILSLLGVRDSGPWAWNGAMPDLEGQIRQSIQGTMQGAKPATDQVHDLAAYLRTLAPPPSLASLRGQADEAAVRRGRAVFEKQSCGSCHTPPAYTSEKTYHVGLKDEAGQTAFNPPSLRGAGQGGPYFHDGRAATLEEVLGRYWHQLQSELAKEELADLLSFLRSL